MITALPNNALESLIVKEHSKEATLVPNAQETEALSNNASESLILKERSKEAKLASNALNNVFFPLKEENKAQEDIHI